MNKAMLLTLGFSCLLAGMVVPVSAQSGNQMRLKGEVPFAFVSADRTIQAGQYFIELGQTQVRLLDVNGNQVQSIFSNPRQDNDKLEQPRLVFHRYGKTYFLWQIWTGDYKADLRTSRSEYQLKADLKADQSTVTLSVR